MPSAAPGRPTRRPMRPKADSASVRCRRARCRARSARLPARRAASARDRATWRARIAARARARLRDDVGSALQTTIPAVVASSTSTLSTPTPRARSRAGWGSARSGAASTAWPRHYQRLPPAMRHQIGPGLLALPRPQCFAQQRPRVSAIGSATTRGPLIACNAASSASNPALMGFLVCRAQVPQRITLLGPCRRGRPR